MHSIEGEEQNLDVLGEDPHRCNRQTMLCMLSARLEWAGTSRVHPACSSAQSRARYDACVSLRSVRRSQHSLKSRQLCARIKGAQLRTLATAAAPSLGTKAAQATGAGGLPAMLLSLGIFLLGTALAALALAAIPAVLEMRRTAKEMQRLLRTLEQEVPETAATMRLTGLELSDAIEEVSLLSTDVTRGVRASARLLQDAEKGVRQGVALAQAAAASQVLPVVKAQVPKVKGIMEEKLKANSKLTHTDRTLLQMATATKLTARRLRFALAAANVVGRANLIKESLRRQAIAA